MRSTDAPAPTHRSRRDVLRILAVGGAAAVAWRLGLFGRRGTARPVTRTRVLMGTTVHLTVLGDDRDAAAAAAEETLRSMAGLETLLSRYRDDSEVSRLNATGRVVGASDALLDVLRLASRISALGDGAFDVTLQPVLDVYRERLAPGGALPAADAVERALERVDYRAVRIDGRAAWLDRAGMRITLDGIGKGYIVDRGVDVLRQRGFANVLVDAGGDLMASGDRSGAPWRIGIRSPRPGLAIHARLDTRNRALATSGDYLQPFTPDFRQHHILDPRTGYSAPHLASATVAAPDAATADALATLAMVLEPRRSRELLEDLPGCEAYLVSKDLDVTRTAGFRLV